jgi:hypothetical protein
LKTKVRDTNTHKHTNKLYKGLHDPFIETIALFIFASGHVCVCVCVCVWVCVGVCVWECVCYKTSMFAFHKVSFCVIEFSLFTLCPLFHNLSLCSIRYPSISISPHSSYFLSFRQLQDNLNRLFDFFDIVFHSTKAFCSIQNVKK